MTVDKAGFAERVFEFAFNAEYCVKNKAILAACPYIPTQQQEKRLGYDVAMTIAAKGGGVSSVFLQHKVSRYVDTRAGSNARFYDAVGGSYFAFPLDVEQYNLIHHAAAVGNEAFFYCAPAFTTRKAMDEKFFAQTVVDDSVWIDVAGAGEIGDTKAHCIVYNGDASQVWRFSEEPVRASGRSAKGGIEASKRIEKFDRDTVANTYEALFRDLKDWWPERRKVRRKADREERQAMPDVLPPHRDIGELHTAIEAVRELAVEYYGVSWLVGVRQ
ncbi:MAG: hypothetical protein JSR69_21850 [Proteobacteria bacterium]|nr:hypothetical protein [Pseudomonadota bacterium]